jgi:hypothetical protein
MGRQIGAWEARARVRLGNVSTTVLLEESLQDHVLAAVRRFSSDRARVVHFDFAGNGVAFDIAISSLTSWVHGFSSVEAIEYPQGDREPTYLDDQSFVLYPAISVPTAVRLLSTVPATGQTARLFYSAPWPVPTEDPDDDLISNTDYEPVVALAASTAALELAGRAAGTQRNTLGGADLVGESSESERWLQIARSLAKEYGGHVGSGEGDGEAPAQAVTDWDARSTWDDTGRLFIFRKRRR